MDMPRMIDKNIELIISRLPGVDLRGQSVLVTGGAGFLGSWMCDVLLKMQAVVVCLDNLSSGLERNIAHLHGRPGFTFIKADISEPLKLDAPFNLVMHMASRASPFEFSQYPLEILKANTIGAMNALGIARRHKARFLFTSTSETYGEPAVLPTPETYRGNVSATGPRGCYDESKRCGEAFVMAFCNQYGLDARIARIFNTYGPRMREDGIYGRVVPRFISQALANVPITVFSDGLQTRSFTYMADQVEGLLKLACTAGLAGKVVNIGNDKELTILELAKNIIELTKSKSELAFEPLPIDDPARRCPDILLAKALLGWQPTIGLDTGLSHILEWLRVSDNRDAVKSQPGK